MIGLALSIQTTCLPENLIKRYRLVVRTGDSHSPNRGSIPLTAVTFSLLKRKSNQKEKNILSSDISKLQGYIITPSPTLLHNYKGNGFCRSGIPHLPLIHKNSSLCLDKQEVIVNNIGTGWQFTRLPDALRRSTVLIYFDESRFLI